MICFQHGVTYSGQCPECLKKEREKAQGWVDQQKSPKLWQKPDPRSPMERVNALSWKNNPVYDDPHNYSLAFKAKVVGAKASLANTYPVVKGLKQFGDLGTALDQNLDDIFQVSKDEGEWTRTCHALGGNHGKVVMDGTKVLGTIVCLGCTTYSRVSGEGAVEVDAHETIKGMFDNSKRIYLRGQNVGASTLVHEMLHFCCHKDFFDAFAGAKTDAEFGPLNEGVTEYLSRKTNGVAKGSYETELATVRTLAQNGLTDSVIEKAYFEGEVVPFQKTVRQVKDQMDSLNMSLDKAKELSRNVRGGFRRGGPSGPKA